MLETRADDRLTIGLDIVRVKAIRISRARGVEQEELEGAGRVAIAEALGRARTVPQFVAYANRRIEGAMIDACRGVGLLSHDEKRMATRVARAARTLRVVLDREPTAAEIGARIQEPTETVDQSLEAMSRSRWPVDAAESVPCSASYLPSIYRHELQRAMAKMTERNRTVVSLHYFDEMTLSAIGRRFHVTEARACQIVKQAVRELREKLEVEEQAHGN